MVISFYLQLLNRSNKFDNNAPSDEALRVMTCVFSPFGMLFAGVPASACIIIISYCVKKTIIFKTPFAVLIVDQKIVSYFLLSG